MGGHDFSFSHFFPLNSFFLNLQDRIDQVLQDLENRQIRTIGEWLSIRKYEPLLIPDLGRSMMNAIDAAIELYQNNRLEEISV